MSKIYGQWFETKVETTKEISLQDYLREVVKVPKKLLHQMRMDKAITVNGKAILYTDIVKNNDKLQLKLFADAEYGYEPTPLDVEVLYEDEHLLVANKKAGMNTHPNDEKNNKTLCNAIAYHLQLNGEQRKINHIHRLDKDTSGLILFSKHGLAGALLDEMLAKREIKRTYLALVHGRIRQKKGTINAPIAQDRHVAGKRRVDDKGQQAITHFKVVKYFSKEDLTLVECSLDTGRTHQIRVHLAHLGHPIVGDELYGGSNVIKRQALHAYKLQFIHPFTGEEIDLTSKNTDTWYFDQLINQI